STRPVRGAGPPGTPPVSSPSPPPSRPILVADRQFLARSRLHAAAGRRDRLSGVAESARVEEVAHLAHLGEVLLAEEIAHERELLDADAVFAREAAAHAADELQ